ncbi:hypothetical protein ANO11243_060730 [Dothideomycetidae sp. 11243]|nr:hypothetical protein ANO11243_060730 [fungal sp. No.11243]
MSANDLQALLRFLSKDAKVPLATAMAKVKDMQGTGLGSIEAIAKSDVQNLAIIFNDEKMVKAILSAAKRVSKKRAAGEPDAIASTKRQRKDPFEVPGSIPPVEVEKSLELPSAELSIEKLEDLVFVTNRAPLVLAFAATLVKHTMPEQPPSSRLSIAQAVVSLGSQGKAKSIGLSTRPTAEDEGWGKGQPVIRVMNREISVLKRWGYEWRPPPRSDALEERSNHVLQDRSTSGRQDVVDEKDGEAMDDQGHPALWAIDLEQLKHLNGPLTFSAASSADTAGLPVYSPQAARNYLYRSFDTHHTDGRGNEGSPKKRPNAAALAAERETNVSALLQSLDLLYSSWKDTLTDQELDKRAWSWYVKVRPEVEHGVAGWGAKGPVRLKDILELRRKS